MSFGAKRRIYLINREDVSLTLNMTNDRCLDSLHLFYYSLHGIACKQSLRMLRSSVRLRLLRMTEQCEIKLFSIHY